MSADCPDAPECAMKSAQATAKRKIDTLENVASVLDRIEALRSARSIDLATPQAAPTTDGVREAFVAGAAWHEFYETGATIWTSDRRNAEAEAERRFPTNEWIESPRLTAAEGRARELESLLRECNAVCLCGCPEADHEADECGEGCEDPEHTCVRVPEAVLGYVQSLREQIDRGLPPEVEAAAARKQPTPGSAYDLPTLAKARSGTGRP